METLTATLVKKTLDQRFYKLNNKITKGIRLGKSYDLIEALNYSKEHDFKPEYKHLCPLDGFDLICVSDAHTHTERLVFGAIQWDEIEIGRTRVQVDGAMTMSIHGGDSSSVKPDYVYIRRLAKMNGFKFNFKNLS